MVMMDNKHTSSRSILASQLRNFAVETVAHASRTANARRHLALPAYDFVLCENHFAVESTSGQDLLVFNCNNIRI